MHSRSGGANRISSTLSLSSLGQAGKPRCRPLNLGNLYSTPGMGLRYQSGEERHSKHSSVLKKKTKCAFLAITMETILRCLSGPSTGNGGNSLFPLPTLSVPLPFSFLLGPKQRFPLLHPFPRTVFTRTIDGSSG